MIVRSNVGGPGATLTRRARTLLAASVDVEWSKNYKIKNGNRPFCYSIAWVEIPHRRTAADLTAARWGYTSVYLDDDTERPDLIDLAAHDLSAALSHADFVTGHQLSSDLAVLAANTDNVPQAIRTAQQAWRDRRTDHKVTDTRYDAGAILTGQSRRLVDVCTELDLDVTQPELARKSMTALHRDWLTTRDTEARERVTVLNLRHSLSTALVALRARDHGTWTSTLNTNQMLSDQLRGEFDWITTPTFQQLLRSPHADA
ncbi:hypothetical protein F4553_008079 [Allocatelliglobosispora scoriae]|uniref:Uncharacterized protein n=1 Tax=Allocatelliglobosispora scoriae TaxID=643052 RepID=A0A841C432_9ACTN|nr:hypothetical protein [Allocatelliglobosispora scoriae]MBB5874645.1 hypothetical protein [Allocatelliglobosispora scoriae]